MTQSWRFSRNSGLFSVILLAGASSVYGVMDAGKEFVLDFNKPEQVKMKATWNDADKFGMTDEGFGWDGPRNASRDLAIQSTELVGVGWSWRPVTGRLKVHHPWTGQNAPPFRFWNDILRGLQIQVTASVRAAELCIDAGSARMGHHTRRSGAGGCV